MSDAVLLTAVFIDMVLLGLILLKHTDMIKLNQKVYKIMIAIAIVLTISTNAIIQLT